MRNISSDARKGIFWSFVVFGLFAAMMVLPFQFVSKATNGKRDRSFVTRSHVEGLENYDIRNDKAAAESLVDFRARAGKDAFAVDSKRAEFTDGEAALRQRVPSLKIEYSEGIRVPEVISPDFTRYREFLTGATEGKRAEVLRGFLKENNSLIGMSDEQLDGLKITADYTNPDGNLSYARLEQTINGIPVFRGEVNAGFTRRGELGRIINNLAPGLEYNSLSADFGDPVNAVKSAFTKVGRQMNSEDITKNDALSNDLKVKFGNGNDWATTAERIYFPTEPGVARAAWRVLIWEPVSAYYVIVDAETGAMLWRKNISEDQTQPATYNVYANTTSPLKALTSPAPLNNVASPALGTQGAVVARTNVTLIGNEAPYAFNNNGWITDGTNGVNGTTDGNALEAGLDIDGVNGVDPTGKADGTARVFNFAYNPGPGNPAPGDAPTLPAYRNGAVTQLFYYNNRYHDEMYTLGFTELARNFQASNFGRGGAEVDRVSGEAQDSSGTNNANFATPADGGRGRMQMFIFTGPTPDYDGDLDGDVVIHEHTHGLSNRLVGNAAGLTNNQGRGMGEGWSDFYGLALLSNPADNPLTTVTTTGGWATRDFGTLGTQNYYYGIRRFPYAVMSLTGGALNRPHNPLTFADIDAAQINTTDGAFANSPLIGNTATEVHNVGEIWCVALWEARAKFIARLGAVPGNRKILQLVTDGLKLTPNAPNLIQARDAIISAAAMSAAAPDAGADVVDVREGFRIRGMGFSATTNGTTVVEAFDTPNVAMINPFSVSDSTGDNDGFPEPGENVLLSVAVTNATGAAVNTVVANVNGGTNVAYGNIADAATVVRQIPYTIPAGAACGSSHTVTINVSSALGAQTPQMRSFTLGAPIGGFAQNFDGVTVPALPAGWVTNLVGTGPALWTTTATGPDTAPNSAFTNDPATLGESSIETPAIPISSATANVSFRINFITESTFDGMVLEISNPTVNAGAYQDIVTAGGSFATGGYNGTISLNFSSPIAGRMAWTGNSGGYISSTANLPASANGQSIKLRWRMASDVSVAATGVNLDSVSLVNGFTCSLVASVRSRSDFDGDGRTDLSIFRPSEGNWYLNRSTAGFGVMNWGLAADVLAPADYDNDGKADTAIFRADANPANPDFFILNSMGFTVSGASWGLPGDIPVVRDYDGDGRADIAVFRPSSNTWFILRSTGGNTITVFGQAGDVPVAGDFDGDGRGDLTVYRAGTWMSQLSGGGTSSRVLGMAGDVLVPADYDNDNRDDVAVFRNGSWIRINSNGGATVTTAWGTTGDIPVPGDYDGDGADDQAIYRNGQWWLNRSTSGVSVQNFGVMTDRPIPRAYVP